MVFWFKSICNVFILTLFALTAKINETDTFGPGDDDEIQFDDIGDDDEDIDDVSPFNVMIPAPGMKNFRTISNI